MIKDLDRMDAANKKYTYAVYILQALFFVGLIFTPIVGIIINYIKDEDVKGTLLESHFLWQKRTFWYGLLWFLLGSLVFFIIGWVVIFVASIWYFYRIAKGWIFLVDGKPMYG